MPATIDELKVALRKAARAGDTVAAKRFADRIKSMKASTPKQEESVSVGERFAAIPRTLKQAGRVLDDTVRVGVDSLTMGLLDKYASNPEEERAKTSQAEERLSQGAGGEWTPMGIRVAGAALPAVAGVGLPSLAARTPGLLGAATRVGLSAAEGGAWGAGNAFGHDEEDIVGPALTGTAFGAGGQLLGEGIGAAAGLLRKPNADRILADQIGDQGPAIQARIDADPDTLLGAEMGSRGARLARTAVNRSPEAEDVLVPAVERLRGTRADQVTEAYAGAGGIPPNSRLSEEDILENFNATRRDTADDLYQRAYQELYDMPKERVIRNVKKTTLEPDPQDPTKSISVTKTVPQHYTTDVPEGFYDILAQTERGRQAWTSAKKTVKDDEILGNIGGDLKRLDETKKFADGKRKAAQRSGDNNEARLWGNLANRIKDRLESLPYESARAYAQQTMKGREAIERGTSLAKRSPSLSLLGEAEQASAHPLLGQPQKQAFAQEKIRQGESSTSPTELMRRHRAAISPEANKAVFGAIESAKIDKAMSNAEIAERLHRATVGNSSTAKQLFDAAATAGLGYGAGSMFYGFGDPKSMGIGIALGLTRYGFNKKRAADIAEAYEQVAQRLAGRTVPRVDPRKHLVIGGSGPAALGNALLGE